MKQVVRIQTFWRGRSVRKVFLEKVKVIRNSNCKAAYLQRLLKGIYVRNQI